MIYSRARPHAPTTAALPAMISRADHDAAIQAVSRVKDAEIARLTARVAELEGASAQGDADDAQQQHAKQQQPQKRGR